MKIVTIWSRKEEIQSEYQFNHISDGFDPDTKTPPACTPDQAKAWKNADWLGEEGVMDNSGKVKPLRSYE